MARPRLSPWTQWRADKPLKRRPLELVPGFLSRQEAASLRRWGHGRCEENKSNHVPFTAPALARLLWRRFSESQWNSLVDAYGHRWRAVGLHPEFLLTKRCPVRAKTVVLGAGKRSFATFWVFLTPGRTQASARFRAPRVAVAAEEGLLLVYLTQDWFQGTSDADEPGLRWLLEGHVLYEADPWRSSDEEILREEWAHAYASGSGDPEAVRACELALATLFGTQSEKVRGLSGEDIVMEDLLLDGATTTPLSPPPEL